jgi:3-oxoacyl-[acyl-carrier-protein] synthase II
LGAVTPLGLDVGSTWTSLLEGTSGVNYITAFDAESMRVNFAAEVKGFDPDDFMERKESRRLDRFTQFAAVAANEALAQARLDVEQADPYRVAVILGSGVGGVMSLTQEMQVVSERGPRRVSPFLLPMMLSDMASAKVSMMFGARGPNINVVSACSSSADALGHAWRMIQSGEMDIVIAGGSDAPLCPVIIAGFDNMRALSRRSHAPEKASRPFDKERDGFVIGEGAGILVLESAESVAKRNAKPLVELAGYAATSDSHHVVEPAPEGRSATKAVELAMERAGLSPKEIGYVNAHGTSTPLNDSVETRVLKQALGETAYLIPINSTKSMLGHSLGAAGAIEAVITAKSILHGTVHPTINLESPDPECDLDYTTEGARKATIRAALSNSFGFGGHNSVLAFKAVEA